MNKYAFDFIKAHEGCKLTAYKDIVGVWTIGYGHTGPEVHAGLVWSQQEADDALERDITAVEREVMAMVRVALGPQAMGALISFAFNLGGPALKGSEALAKTNAGDHLAAAKLLLNWDHAGGKEVKGLLIRRLEEAALYLKGV